MADLVDDRGKTTTRSDPAISNQVFSSVRTAAQFSPVRQNDTLDADHGEGKERGERRGDSRLLTTIINGRQTNFIMLCICCHSYLTNITILLPRLANCCGLARDASIPINQVRYCSGLPCTWVDCRTSEGFGNRGMAVLTGCVRRSDWPSNCKREKRPSDFGPHVRRERISPLG